MSELQQPKIAILASGGGSTAEAFIHATQDGTVDAAVDIVICNKSPDEAGVYSRVHALNDQYGLGIDVVEISGRTHPKGKVGRGQTLEESTAICELLDQRRIDHVGLMGYMTIVGGELLDAYGYNPNKHHSMYEARMSNTHPGPLPETEDTYGVRPSEIVLEKGLPFSKHTVHVVAAGVDKGPIIAERPVEVIPGDTPQELFDRVQVTEKSHLPVAIDAFLKKQQEMLLRQSLLVDQ